MTVPTVRRIGWTRRKPLSPQRKFFVPSVFLTRQPEKAKLRRDVGRALNMTYAEVDVVAKQVPAGPGALHITLAEALKLSKQLADMYREDPRVKKLIDTAMALEGMPRHASTHAAGVVITKLPVYEYVPLARNDDAVVCQYVMTTLEELGLLKMDFLGLRNLTVLDDAVKMVQQREPDFALSKIPDDDAETYDMISRG